MSPKEISAKRGKPFQLVRAAGSGVSNPFRYGWDWAHQKAFEPDYERAINCAMFKK
jgi:hypothetical protein